MKRWAACGLMAVGLYWSGCFLPTNRLDDYAVQGIDISHYQSYLNWDTIARQDIAFAFVKATEGVSLSDSLYCHNWNEMKRVGIKRGAYHFFLPSIPAYEQARNFTNWVELEYGDLPPVLDVEVLEGVSKYALISRMRTWLTFVEVRYGIKPIIYTNLRFYNRFLAGHFDDYPVWIARYNTREPRLACGREWQFWQYGNRGQLKGVAGHIDFNVFNGNYEDLNQFCLQPSTVLSNIVGQAK